MNWIEVALRPPTIPSTFEISGKKMETEQDTAKNKMVDTTFLHTRYILLLFTYSFVEKVFRLKSITKSCYLNGT